MKAIEIMLHNPMIQVMVFLLAGYVGFKILKSAIKTGIVLGLIFLMLKMLNVI